jgi:hypothetical protein
MSTLVRLIVRRSPVCMYRWAYLRLENIVGPYCQHPITIKIDKIQSHVMIPAWHGATFLILLLSASEYNAWLSDHVRSIEEHLWFIKIWLCIASHIPKIKCILHYTSICLSVVWAGICVRVRPRLMGKLTIDLVFGLFRLSTYVCNGVPTYSSFKIETLIQHVFDVLWFVTRLPHDTWYIHFVAEK